MVKLFRDSVNLADLWVSSHDKLSDFYLTSWQRGESPVPMFVVRLMLTAMSMAILTWSLVDDVLAYWPVYLTHWGLTLLSAMFLSGLLVSSLAVCGKIKDDTKVPWFISMYWFLYNQAVCIAIMITALYWILLYNPGFHVTRLAFWLDVTTHACNSAIALSELLISRTPVRFLHFYQPLGFGLWYAAFTGIYFAAGGTGDKGEPYIYEVLDWRNGRRTATIVSLCIVGVIAVYTILWALAQCRNYVSTWLVRTISHDLPPTPPDDFTHSRMV